MLGGSRTTRVNRTPRGDRIGTNSLGGGSDVIRLTPHLNRALRFQPAPVRAACRRAGWIDAVGIAFSFGQIGQLFER